MCIELERRRYGEKLRQHRKAASLSQDVLADLVGISRPQIANIETGVSFPSQALATRLSVALKRDLSVPDLPKASRRSRKPEQLTYRQTEKIKARIASHHRRIGVLAARKIHIQDCIDRLTGEVREFRNMLGDQK